jgi:DNA-binding beta-propeller fold protein YncE
MLLVAIVACRSDGAATGLSATTPSPSSSGVPHHLEYLFVDQAIFVYDMDHDHKLVRRIDVPQVTRVKGVVASVATGMLYISFGNRVPYGQSGSMLKYDLVADRVIWEKRYAVGVDSMCITPDGRKIYLPSGDFTEGDSWHIVDAETGDLIADLSIGAYPHNTICGLSGKQVFLGATGHWYFTVVDPATDTVVRSIGPLGGGVRPFTVNAKETLAYININGLLGFVVVDITSGQVLYRTSPDGFSWSADSGVCPSHGIALSPDEREVWVIDQPNNAVHVFDVTGVPASPPRLVASIQLTGSLSGHQDSGPEREGWLGFSRDGRFVYVGDAGDVIDALARTTVARLEPLANTRQFIEIDFADGIPVFTSSRYAIGYMTE